MPSQPSTGTPRRLRLHAPRLALIVGLALAAYSNTFSAEFVFDDHDWIVANPVIRDLRNYLVEGTGYDQHPNRYLANLTLALNYAVGGLHPRGYHVVNFCIHAANVVLVYALVVLLFRTPVLARSRLAGSSHGIAFTTAALFAVHPLQTQAVTYVIQRLTSLATGFYLLAVVLYLAWRVGAAPGTGRLRVRTVALYGGSLAAIVAAMKTKEIAFTLPLVLAACELWFFPWTTRLVVRLLPAFATLAIIPLSMIDLGRSIEDVGLGLPNPIPQETLAAGDYVRTQLAIVTTYLRLLLLPIGQNVDHDYPAYGSLAEPRIVLAMIVLAAVGAVGVWTHRRSAAGGLDEAARLVSFGIAWFFLTVAVESLVPLPDVIFEHRAYLPSIGVFVACIAAAALLLRGRARGRTAALVTAAAISLPVLLAAATFRRNGVWATAVTLWTDAAAKSPDKLRPRYNLGEALVRSGDRDAAIPQYLRALEISPLHPESHNNLGVQYHARGRIDEAIAHFRAALAVKPDYPEAHLNLGIAYGDKGWMELAQQEMAIGVRLKGSAKRGP